MYFRTKKQIEISFQTVWLLHILGMDHVELNSQQVLASLQPSQSLKQKEAKTQDEGFAGSSIAELLDLSRLAEDGSKDMKLSDGFHSDQVQEWRNSLSLVSPKRKKAKVLNSPIESPTQDHVPESASEKEPEEEIEQPYDPLANFSIGQKEYSKEDQGYFLVFQTERECRNLLESRET